MRRNHRKETRHTWVLVCIFVAALVGFILILNRGMTAYTNSKDEGMQKYLSNAEDQKYFINIAKVDSESSYATGGTDKMTVTSILGNVKPTNVYTRKRHKYETLTWRKLGGSLAGSTIIFKFVDNHLYERQAMNIPSSYSSTDYKHLMKVKTKALYYDVLPKLPSPTGFQVRINRGKEQGTYTFFVKKQKKVYTLQFSGGVLMSKKVRTVR